jgi:hypothetical protein
MRAFHFRDRFTFFSLYKQYVRPHLELAVQAWCPWTQQDRELLKRVQKCAVGMVSGLKGRTYDQKLTDLELTTLEEWRHQSEILQVYKMLTTKDNVSSDHWLKKEARKPIRMRQAEDLMNIVKQRSRLKVQTNFVLSENSQRLEQCPREHKNGENRKPIQKATGQTMRIGQGTVRVGGRETGDEEPQLKIADCLPVGPR